ncbi:hypothetical protein [Hydrogenophaga taeniospiralis]|uniref:hypothetical protein n=1 Tax=Hydrogenophaga taeniospiralis TaxID=65656 RepID=UPI001CFABE87|nr:hypothetical protein [Hydrogenophaga taeniospiralis]UCU94511.1 hypothetical protein KI616_01090 [Hydrogenophaga taeniospiralis]
MNEGLALFNQIGSSKFRSDLYNVCDYWGDWDTRMSEAGFANGWQYKQYLLNSLVMDSSQVELYDALRREAWKEDWSERIKWDKLPSEYEYKDLKLPYRSPLHYQAHASLSVLRDDVDIGQFSSLRLQNTQPYFAAAWALNPDPQSNEATFRKSLIDAASSEEHIAAARAVGVDPIGKAANLKEVKRSIQSVLVDKGLARPASGQMPSKWLVYGHDLGNGLVLCFCICEIQHRSYGKSVYRLSSIQSLVRNEHVMEAWGFPREHPWSMMEDPSIYSGYGVRDESPVPFYVHLAYELKSFQIKCEAFDAFFSNPARQ